jgi:hypothetical protein
MKYILTILLALFLFVGVAQAQGFGNTYVNTYQRSNGTVVQGHYRSKPRCRSLGCM